MTRQRQKAALPFTHPQMNWPANLASAVPLSIPACALAQFRPSGWEGALSCRALQSPGGFSLLVVRRASARTRARLHKANKRRIWYPALRMAHRPTSEELDCPFTPQEIATLRQRLSRLAPSKVIDEYHQVYEKCSINGDQLPRAEIYSGTGGGLEGVVARKKEEEAREKRVNKRPHPSPADRPSDKSRAVCSAPRCRICPSNGTSIQEISIPDILSIQTTSHRATTATAM